MSLDITARGDSTRSSSCKTVRFASHILRQARITDKNPTRGVIQPHKERGPPTDGDDPDEILADENRARKKAFWLFKDVYPRCHFHTTGVTPETAGGDSTPAAPQQGTQYFNMFNMGEKCNAKK